MKRLIVPIAVAMLAGCSSEIDELKTFVRESEKGLPRRVEPLPAVKPFEPFTYEGFDLPDPFKPRKLTPPKEGGAGGGLAPDLNRRKEPLEAFPLEQLKMVARCRRARHLRAGAGGQDALSREEGQLHGPELRLDHRGDRRRHQAQEIVQDSAAIGPSGRAFCRCWRKPAKGTESEKHAPHPNSRQARGRARRVRLALAAPAAWRRPPKRGRVGHVPQVQGGKILVKTG